MARTPTRIALTLALSSTVWLQLPQQGERAKPGERDIFGRPMNLEPSHDLLQSMQGAWRLVKIEDELLPLAGRSHYGYVTFADRFMSVEIHMRWSDRGGETLEDAFQSGIHEIEFIAPGRIRTTTLIGSYLDDWEQLEWEVPGFNREFEVTVSGDQLSLRRDVGSEMIFRRQAIGRGVFTDIFGTVEGPKDDVDIFGAPMQRPQPEPPEDPGEDPGDDPEEGPEDDPDDEFERQP